MHHAPWRHDETPAANKGARPRSDFGGERLSRCRSEPRHQCLLHGRALGNDGRHTGPLGTALPLPPHPWNGQSAALGWFGLWLISLRTHLAVRHDWRFVAGLWRRPLRSANGVARRVPSGLARQRSAQSLFHDDRPDRRLRDRRTSRLRRVLHLPGHATAKVYVAISVPSCARPGEYTGTLVVHVAGSPKDTQVPMAMCVLSNRRTRKAAPPGRQPSPRPSAISTVTPLPSATPRPATPAPSPSVSPSTPAPGPTATPIPTPSPSQSGASNE